MFDSTILPGPPTAVSEADDAWSTYSPDGLLADMLSEVSGGSSWDRLERIGGWERLIAWAQAAQVREIARFASAAVCDPAFGSDPEQVQASVIGEVGLMTRLAPRTAAGRVADAVTLVQRLPATMAALSDGRISMAAARAIAEETLSLGDEHLDQVQAQVLERAGEQTPSQIRAAVRRAVARADAEAVRRRAERARRERSVALIPEPDGMAILSAYLPAADAVAAYGVLDDCARRAAGPDETRTMDARRADALVDLILDRDSCDVQTRDGAHSEPNLPRDRAKVHVRVTMSLTTLLGLDQLPGELAGYGPVPADMARQLAAEGTWRRLLTDPISGALLDYGTTRYRPPAHLAEHVITRDHTCGHPGCRIPAHRCNLDHVIPFNPDNNTGPTSADNLDPKCTPHHLLKHSPGWHNTRQPDGSLTWTTPTGHTYTPNPHPHSANPTHHPPRSQPHPTTGLRLNPTTHHRSETSAIWDSTTRTSAGRSWSGHCPASLKPPKTRSV